MNIYLNFINPIFLYELRQHFSYLDLILLKNFYISFGVIVVPNTCLL